MDIPKLKMTPIVLSHYKAIVAAKFFFENGLHDFLRAGDNAIETNDNQAEYKEMEHNTGELGTIVDDLANVMSAIEEIYKIENP